MTSSHTCHFCGEWLDDNSCEYNGDRHWLSDCRPDLVAHEIGETCTWSYATDVPRERRCYGYQDEQRRWTKDHVHFYPDGPMT